MAHQDRDANRRNKGVHHKPIRMGDSHTVVRVIVIRHALKTAPSRAIVELAINLWERTLAIRIFPITPAHTYPFENKNSRYENSVPTRAGNSRFLRGP